MGDLGSPGCAQCTLATLPVPNPTKSFWQATYPNPIINERTTPELPSEADAVVVGSGITAAFAVRELLTSSTSKLESEPHRRLNIVVVEARTTCSGATGRNGGHCQPIIHEAAPDIIDFEMKNFEDVEKLIEQEGIECDWRRLEGCMAFWNKTYFEEAKSELEERERSDPRHAKLVKVVEDKEGMEMLRLGRGAEGAIVQSVAATLSPYKLVIWIWRDLLRRYKGRLNIQTTTPVTTIEIDDSGRGRRYLCQTPRGSITAKHVLLATNAYTSHLSPQFETLIRPVQGQMSALVPPASFKGELLSDSYGFLGTGKKDRVMSDYLHQRAVEEGGYLMFGGARECVVNHGEGVSDDGYVDEEAEKYLRRLPELLNLTREGEVGVDVQENGKLGVRNSWTGIMGYSSDHFPWVGGVLDHEGLWICAGYTGHGMTNASGCGKHVARLVSAATEGGDWREVERKMVQEGSIPIEYVVTKARFEREAEKKKS